MFHAPAAFAAPTTKKGRRDRRYRLRPRLRALAAAHPHTRLVDEIYERAGARSISNARVFDFVVLQDLDTSETFNLGRGEAREYFGYRGLPKRSHAYRAAHPI